MMPSDFHPRFPPGPVPPSPENTPIPPQVVGQVIKPTLFLYNVCLSGSFSVTQSLCDNVNLACRMEN